MSDAHRPTAILELKSRIEILPARRKAAERMATIRALRERARGAAAQQMRALEEIACTQQTFTAASVGQAQTTTRKNAKMANRLLKELATIESVDKRSIDNMFQDLSTSAAKAVSLVEAEWLAQVSAVVSRYQRIVEVAERAGLRGSHRLNETLGRIQAVTKPKCNDSITVATQLVVLQEAVRTLGLEGEGGTFLTRVADGSAKAHDLTRPEIVQFLTTYDLWPLLTVRFS